MIRPAGVHNKVWEDIAKIQEADVAKLTKIIQQAKTALPDNYGKKWSENDVIKLSTFCVEGMHPHEIALRLKRTENAIREALSKIGFSYWMIPIIKENKIVAECAAKQNSKSPNPER